MALPRPTIEKALLEVIKNPVATVPGTHPDIARRTAAADLATMTYAAHVGTTPQDTAAELQITINRLSGNTQSNCDSFTRVRWPIVEVQTWAKITDNRANRQAILDLSECLHVLLNGMAGTFAGLQIHAIQPEVDPFQQDDPPRNDGNDQWLAGYTYTYNCQTENAAPDTRLFVPAT